MGTHSKTPLAVRVAALAREASRIVSYDLRPLNAELLPSFSAGAHIDILLPNGLIRSYSLLNSQTERHRYVIAVQREDLGRGGSKWIHDNVRLDDVLEVGRPRNNFRLDEGADQYLFIAGGIGITPIRSMIARLSEVGSDWRLLYCARTRESAAFLAELESYPNVQLNFDEEPCGKRADIEGFVRNRPKKTHFYCCGPKSMLSTFEKATAAFPRNLVHIERFNGPDIMPSSTDREFKVVLKRSGREFTVHSGATILSTLLEAGLEIPCSCMSGVCGSCETKVIDGSLDHRDLLLTEAERAEGKTMMICCSRAKSERLILDL